MKQKLGIVAAFMHDPDILILDEPTSGLDPLMQSRFIDLIAEEKKHGKTILMSSHMFVTSSFILPFSSRLYSAMFSMVFPSVIIHKDFFQTLLRCNGNFQSIAYTVKIYGKCPGLGLVSKGYRALCCLFFTARVWNWSVPEAVSRENLM